MKKIKGFSKLMAIAAGSVLAMPDALGALLREFHFEHRGHGGKHRPKAKRGFGWGKVRSKYQPHQGKSECARRVMQMQRAGGAA